MLTQFSRTELLLGKEAMERLAQSRVAVFGVGGVGGYVVEALVLQSSGFWIFAFQIRLSTNIGKVQYTTKMYCTFLHILCWL